jgi:hypothetical protein
MTKNYFKKLIPSYKNDVFYFAFPERLPSSREASRPFQLFKHQVLTFLSF